MTCRPVEWPAFGVVMSLCVFLRFVLLVGVAFVVFFVLVHVVPGLSGIRCALCVVYFVLLCGLISVVLLRVVFGLSS